jgi:tripartite-type tricarboxylate transporter receptor subunit TctC
MNAALSHVQGGKAIALAVSSAQRSPLLPNVPTVAESGVPGFDYTLWVGLWGPAGIPADLVAKINGDVRRALASPDLSERLTKLGQVPMQMSPQEFTEFVRKELDDTAKVMQAAGIKPQ